VKREALGWLGPGLGCASDVVCVSTFPPSHEEVALAALDLRLKGMLVEKPLGPHGRFRAAVS
jgi:hypothetical protein